MIKVMKQKDIKNLVAIGKAKDITEGDFKTYRDVLRTEEGYDTIAISHGVNGLNGLLIKGWNTGDYYAIYKRSTALFIFT